MKVAPFVLASASPRRYDLLCAAGIPPLTVEAPDINETQKPNELPKDLAQRLAKEKAIFVSKKHPTLPVLGSDTVVAVGRRVLDKPANTEQAQAHLRLLSGRRHRVFGGIFLHIPNGQPLERIVQTVVHFKRLTNKEIDGYLLSNEWQDKAGGYAIQGSAGRFIQSLSGSYSNVVGLSVFDASQMMTGVGLIKP